jgi:hypothetical protein
MSNNKVLLAYGEEPQANMAEDSTANDKSFQSDTKDITTETKEDNEYEDSTEEADSNDDDKSTNKDKKLSKQLMKTTSNKATIPRKLHHCQKVAKGIFVHKRHCFVFTMNEKIFITNEAQ